MGDGNVINRNSSDPFTYNYSNPGNYFIRLTVQNQRGCISPPDSLPARAGALPVAGFILPEVCLNDAFAQFTDSTTIADGTVNQLSYAWTLGDGSLSTDRNPRHKYNAAAIYSITQVVTTNQGCADTLKRDFTVNGAVPNAGFTVENSGVLCSNLEIAIVNASSVNFGSITKLMIYWDALNNPGQMEIDETPIAGKVYRHAYPEFGTPLTKNYTIRFVAYSGQSCVSEQSRVITLQASPQITFDPLGPVCEEVSAFSLTQARENTGLPGTGVFSGPGVSPTGMFDPSIARPGIYTIQYKFNGDNGCTAFKEQSIRVFATPKVDAGPDRTVLEGGFIIINATSSGTGLRYAWTPITGLEDPTILTPRASPIIDTRYNILVTSGEGCSASDDLFVKVLLKPVIPNTFTPNGDGYNDFWEIKSLDSYPGAIVEVFNTTGSLVFRSVGYDKPWDGTMNGKQLVAGTYYYVIDPKNGRQKIAGYVTIFK
jgi:gliding motility-associated-like protein